MSCSPVYVSCDLANLGRQWSGDHAANLEVDDGVLVETDVGQDAVAVLVELRGAGRPGRLLVQLDGRGHQLERGSGGWLALWVVAVGVRVGVRRGGEGVLDDGPRPDEPGEPLTPLGQGGRPEH